jgi:hypothetical protein
MSPDDRASFERRAAAAYGVIDAALSTAPLSDRMVRMAEITGLPFGEDTRLQVVSDVVVTMMTTLRSLGIENDFRRLLEMSQLVSDVNTALSETVPDEEAGNG